MTRTEMRFCLEVSVCSLILAYYGFHTWTVGSDFRDDVVDLMVYFSASAYSGFGDDSKVV